LQALASLLRRDGHQIVTATTIATALEAARANKIDLVMSDIGLPDGSGIELMEELRSTYGLRGIALSGYGTEKDIASTHFAGFVMHLVKPVPAAELRRAIDSLAPAII
jgi:CheY-like chemotaxis protein